MSQPREDQFAAALAHQLKTPTATLQAVAANLKRNMRGLLEDLASMAGAEATYGVTAQFISRVVSEPSPAPLSGLLPQDRVDIIVERLSEAGLEGDLPSAASSLVRGGWDTYMEEILPLLHHDQTLALDILETSARLRANLGAIESALDRIRGLASALRLLSSPCGTERIDLCRNLEAAAAGIRQILPGGVTLRMYLDAMPAVEGNPALLNEVWFNLVTNAVEAAGPSGVITIEGAGAGARSLVKIIDDGPGIEAAVLPRIFEPFFTTRPAHGGTGLGLSLAKRIVEKMGGEIAVDSRPGRTCFEVALPAAATASLVKE